MPEGTDSQVKILIAEDNKVNVKVLLLLLAQYKFDCDTVENGREAVEAAKKTPYNLILMDVHMPKMDGFEATQIIRQQEKITGGHTPIIAVTALSSDDDKQKCLDAGMDDHIAKPIDRDILYVKVNHWLDKNVQSKDNNEDVDLAHYEGIWLDPEDLKRILEHFGDENYDNLLRNYLSSAENYVETLEKLMSERDKFQCFRVLQELNSASADVGARTICKFCRELNDLLSASEWVEGEEHYQDLKETFGEFSKFLKEKLKAD
ncbi:MAG TPA: response regulator [Candidatus Melainabacteria bacterium]|jgi:CheY-like chemotaxis protein/HPt (histidine-containing phosphotransfer) domain-containing protein|nr:response regulator [Candidatus Melainabacteria bacterium]